MTNEQFAINIADFYWQTSSASDIHGTICETSTSSSASDMPCMHLAWSRNDFGPTRGWFSKMSPTNKLKDTYKCTAVVECSGSVMFIAVTRFQVVDENSYFIAVEIDSKRKLGESFRFDQECGCQYDRRATRLISIL